MWIVSSLDLRAVPDGRPVVYSVVCLPSWSKTTWSFESVAPGAVTDEISTGVAAPTNLSGLLIWIAAAASGRRHVGPARRDGQQDQEEKARTRNRMGEMIAGNGRDGRVGGAWLTLLSAGVGRIGRFLSSPSCRYRLGVRTRGSQPRDRGSNPRTGIPIRQSLYSLTPPF